MGLFNFILVLIVFTAYPSHLFHRPVRTNKVTQVFKWTLEEYNFYSLAVILALIVYITIVYVTGIYSIVLCGIALFAFIAEYKDIRSLYFQTQDEFNTFCLFLISFMLMYVGIYAWVASVSLCTYSSESIFCHSVWLYTYLPPLLILTLSSLLISKLRSKEITDCDTDLIVFFCFSVFCYIAGVLIAVGFKPEEHEIDTKIFLILAVSIFLWKISSPKYFERLRWIFYYHREVRLSELRRESYNTVDDILSVEQSESHTKSKDENNSDYSIIINTLYEYDSNHTFHVETTALLLEVAILTHIKKAKKAKRIFYQHLETTYCNVQIDDFVWDSENPFTKYEFEKLKTEIIKEELPFKQYKKELENEAKINAQILFNEWNSYRLDSNIELQQVTNQEQLETKSGNKAEKFYQNALKCMNDEENQQALEWLLKAKEKNHPLAEDAIIALEELIANKEDKKN
jgi:hypothetical protein